jgi:hypothetical protein
MPGQCDHTLRRKGSHHDHSSALAERAPVVRRAASREWQDRLNERTPWDADPAPLTRFQAEKCAALIAGPAVDPRRGRQARHDVARFLWEIAHAAAEPGGAAALARQEAWAAVDAWPWPQPRGR